MPNPIYKDITEEQKASNKYAKIVPGQTIVELPLFTLECGGVLNNFPVAYKTWGRLNESKNNVLLICHAFTGSSDVQDWWGPLLGSNKTFDPQRWFIICINLLGSPYGLCSPVTIDKSTGKPYGPLFPLVTIKDDVAIQKLILDSLGIKGIGAIIGGSMGGMVALEFSATFNDSNYVKAVIALATSARASAWCISWNETQRQCIFSDPNYDEGYYYEKNLTPPTSGLSAARMAALLTYRSRNSFETRFGRNLPNAEHNKKLGSPDAVETKWAPKTKDEENWLNHNEGAKLKNLANGSSNGNGNQKLQTYFTAQSYLRYQGSKFVNRFDSNCYISLSRKLDTHDITRGENRINDLNVPIGQDPLPDYLSTMKKPHLIVGISSDGLFTYSEQQTLGEYIPDAVLKKLDSPEGHDAFLLEFEIIGDYCTNFLKARLPETYSDNVELFTNWQDYVVSVDNEGESVFGEAEKNLTNCVSEKFRNVNDMAIQASNDISVIAKAGPFNRVQVLGECAIQSEYLYCKEFSKLAQLLPFLDELHVVRVSPSYHDGFSYDSFAMSNHKIDMIFQHDSYLRLPGFQNGPGIIVKKLDYTKRGHGSKLHATFAYKVQINFKEINQQVQVKLAYTLSEFFPQVEIYLTGSLLLELLNTFSLELTVSEPVVSNEKVCIPNELADVEDIYELYEYLTLSIINSELITAKLDNYVNSYEAPFNSKDSFKLYTKTSVIGNMISGKDILEGVKNWRIISAHTNNRHILAFKPSVQDETIQIIQVHQ